jgi:flagellar basal-body rod protein FlgB
MRVLLDAASARHTAIASNIANVETPGYKRVDLSPSFNAHLKAALKNGHVPEHSLKPEIVVDAQAPTSRADGNTVQIDQELLEMNRNTADYEVLTQMTSGSFRLLKTAITGNVL